MNGQKSFSCSRDSINKGSGWRKSVEVMEKKMSTNELRANFVSELNTHVSPIKVTFGLEFKTVEVIQV